MTKPRHLSGKSSHQPDPYRDFLVQLEDAQELLRIKDAVDPKYEICAFCRHVADMNGPALLFESIKGHDMPAVANLFGTRGRIALAVGASLSELANVITERLKKRIPPISVNASEAPCQGVVLKGNDIDLGRIPIPFWNVGDGGNYISAGINIGAHPKWGKNAAIYRNMVRSKNEIFAQIAPDHQQRLFYEDIGKGCPMAIVLGADPLLYLAAGSDFPLGDYEVDIAGALRGNSLRVVKATSIDLEVPADAEIIIETEYTGQSDEEGPFNEFTGYQSERRAAPIWSVKAITMRKYPIMHLAFAGKPPNENIAFWRELEDALALDTMRRRFPMVTGVTRPAELARDFWGIIQIKNIRPMYVRNILAGADLSHAAPQIYRGSRRRYRHSQCTRCFLGHFNAGRSGPRYIRR